MTGMHSFTLEQTAEGWRIRRHSLFDTLESDLWYQWMGEREAAGLTGSPGFGSRGDTASAYIEAVPDFLDEYAAALTQRLAEADAEPEPGCGCLCLRPGGGGGLCRRLCRFPQPRMAGLYPVRRELSELRFSGAAGQAVSPMDPYGGAVWKMVWGQRLQHGRQLRAFQLRGSGVKQFIEYARSNTGYGLAAVVAAPLPVR